jgi:hypothetical protein
MTLIEVEQSQPDSIGILQMDIGLEYHPQLAAIDDLMGADSRLRKISSIPISLW